ncbi:MAG: hypothetical protein GXY83_37210 [Rhodopirellula sp.]|nr:hypothetical protein [Rhodopirellula sp.]
MTFLNPLLLAGTALVAVPIILHLIMRQRPRYLEFPALQFIQRRHDTNQRRLRLRHLVLLALRAALIALLAFALARPSVRLAGALGKQEAPVAAALVFDTSVRMNYRHENRTRLQAAQQLGQWLLSQLPAESQIAVIGTDQAPVAFQVDRGAAKHRIEGLETTAVSQPLTDAIVDAVELLGRSELVRKEIYVFSDLAGVSWPEDAAARLQEAMGQLPAVGTYVIDVGVDDPVNSSLGDVRLSADVLSRGSPLTVDTQVFQTGKGSVRTVEFYLLDSDRRPVKRGGDTLSLEDGQSRQITFHIEGLPLGTHQGYVQILGQDGLADDDRRYLTVEVQPAWRVLIVSPKPVDASAVYLSEAIAPTAFRRTGQARFEPAAIPYEKLAETPLDSYSAVCLLDPAPLEAGTWQKLANYTADGHGLAVFFGGNARPVNTFNDKAAQQVLPGKLVRQVRRPDGDTHLSPRDFSHPALAAFRRFGGAIPWEAFPVLRYWQFRDIHKGVAVIVPYSDGEPALLDRPVGQGRVLTMTTPVSDDPNRDPWNLLPVGEAWPFVVLANEAMSYLVGSGEKQLNYVTGQAALLHLDASKPYRAYVLTQPDGLEVRLAADLRRNALMVTATEDPGNYRVQAGGTGGIDRGFSANVPPAQTRLQRATDERLGAIFGEYPYHVARSENEIEREFTAGRVGRELFPMLIGLVALALGLEHVVANRFYRE